MKKIFNLNFEIFCFLLNNNRKLNFFNKVYNLKKIIFNFYVIIIIMGNINKLGILILVLSILKPCYSDTNSTQSNL